MTTYGAGRSLATVSIVFCIVVYHDLFHFVLACMANNLSSLYNEDGHLSCSLAWESKNTEEDEMSWFGDSRRYGPIAPQRQTDTGGADVSVLRD